MFRPKPQNAVLIPPKAKLVFKGQIFEVYQWKQKLYDGSSATFEMLKRPDTVKVICIVDDKILAIHENQPEMYRQLGLPGGRVEKTDDTITAAAKREVLEETGYSFRNWKIVKVEQPATKIDWFVYVLVAYDVIGKDDQVVDGGEIITTSLHSLEDIKQLALDETQPLSKSKDIFDKVESIEELKLLS